MPPTCYFFHSILFLFYGDKIFSYFSENINDSLFFDVVLPALVICFLQIAFFCLLVCLPWSLFMLDFPQMIGHISLSFHFQKWVIKADGNLWTHGRGFCLWWSDWDACWLSSDVSIFRSFLLRWSDIAKNVFRSPVWVGSSGW